MKAYKQASISAARSGGVQIGSDVNPPQPQSAVVTDTGKVVDLTKNYITNPDGSITINPDGTTTELP